MNVSHLWLVFRLLLLTHFPEFWLFNSPLCFFCQDMSRQPPTQELVAKDLHANEWRFRHIFRGIGNVL